MANLTVVGTQWGDEGKGKVVDFLSRRADLVVRFQGGPNAGHTVRFAGSEIVLHQIPCGILTPGVRCVIGCGCVVDPHVVEAEVADLCRIDVRVGRRVVLDYRAHLILPYHRSLDRLNEERSPRERIGTTGRGIGPVYQDKYGRTGLRAADLCDRPVFEQRLRASVRRVNPRLRQAGVKPLAAGRLIEEYWEATRVIADWVGDGSAVVQEALEAGRSVLFEGAQGVHLDIDIGTYPYVTSSITWAGGVAPGTGVSPLWLDEVIGVAKAYMTRVGMGPFPTELTAADSKVLRELGAEFGATTGRPRRCGWFDAPLVKDAVRRNRLSAMVVTKLDVLDSMATLRLCVGYRHKGRRVSDFDPRRAGELEPVLVSMPGWQTPTTGCRRFRDLPLNARRYIRRIEAEIGCPVALVSVGGDRTATVTGRERKVRWLR